MNAFPQSAAAGNNSARRRALVLLALALDLLFWGWVAAARRSEIHLAGWMHEILWSVAFAHTTIVAAWFAAAPRSLFVRSLVLMGFDLLSAGCMGGLPYGVMILAVVLIHQATLVAIYFVLARLRLAPRLANEANSANSSEHRAYEPARRWQLSLAETLALATLLAMIMAAGRWFEFELPILKSGWVVQAVLAALALGILLIWMPPRRKLWIVVATVVALVAPAIVYVLWDQNQTSDLTTYAATIGCAGLVWRLGRGRGLSGPSPA